MMDWGMIWELIRQWGPYLFTLLVMLFGLGAVIKKIAKAMGSTGLATTEAADFMFSIQDMLKDKKITRDELDKAAKEWKEMIEAGKVAVEDWQKVFMELLLKVRKV